MIASYEKHFAKDCIKRKTHLQKVCFHYMIWCLNTNLGQSTHCNLHYSFGQSLLYFQIRFRMLHDFLFNIAFDNFSTFVQ